MQELFIPYEEFPFTNNTERDISFQYGVISWCSNKSGFINVEYVDRKAFPNHELNSDKSVIFSPYKITTIPTDTYFNTRDNIYLVKFAVNGTQFDPPKGIMHPRFDYLIPI